MSTLTPSFSHQPHRASRRILFRLLSIALGVGISFAAQAEAIRLRIGVYGQDPPKSFVDETGKLTGFDIDVARALCAQVRAQCELVPSDWSDLIPGLQERRFNAVVASMSITDARRKLIAFTRAYYNSPGRFVAREGRVRSVDREGIKGLKIGVRRGTTFDNYATDNFSGVSEIYRYSTQPDALLDLMLGRIDLILGDHITIDQNFLKMPQGQGFAFVGPPVADTRWFGYGNGVAVPKGDPGMLQIIDRAVADMQAKGALRRISERWFGYDVSDLTSDLQAQRKSRVR